VKKLAKEGSKKKGRDAGTEVRSYGVTWAEWGKRRNLKTVSRPKGGTHKKKKGWIRSWKKKKRKEIKKEQGAMLRE